MNKLLCGSVLAAALGSAIFGSFVGQIVSPNAQYSPLEGPIFGDRVGIYENFAMQHLVRMLARTILPFSETQHRIE